MVVSTLFDSLSNFACDLVNPSQHLRSRACLRSIHTLGRAVQTMTIYANVTPLYTIFSVPAMRAKESRGFRASIFSGGLPEC
jgi:hypothetical protein